MAEFKKRIVTSADKTVVIPGEIIKLLPDTGEIDLKVLLYSCAAKEFFIDEAASFLGYTAEQINKSIENWTSLGILSSHEVENIKLSKIPLFQNYESKILHDALEEKQSFAYIKNKIEDLMGKVLNKNDINVLYNLHDFCGLSADFICCVAIYCTGRGKNNMNYISKTALSLYEEGIDNYEKLEIHFKEREIIEDSQRRFMQNCGMGGRILTSKERAFLTKWFDEYKMTLELVMISYEKTVDAIGKPNFTYMDKMLEEWNTLQYKTPKDILCQTQKSKKASKGSKNSINNDSFDPDEFWEAALKKG